MPPRRPVRSCFPRLLRPRRALLPLQVAARDRSVALPRRSEVEPRRRYRHPWPLPLAPRRFPPAAPSSPPPGGTSSTALRATLRPPTAASTAIQPWPSTTMSATTSSWRFSRRVGGCGGTDPSHVALHGLLSSSLTPSSCPCRCQAANQDDTARAVLAAETSRHGQGGYLRAAWRWCAVVGAAKARRAPAASAGAGPASGAANELVKGSEDSGSDGWRSLDRWEGGTQEAAALVRSQALSQWPSPQSQRPSPPDDAKVVLSGGGTQMGGTAGTRASERASVGPSGRLSENPREPSGQAPAESPAPSPGALLPACDGPSQLDVAATATGPGVSTAAPLPVSVLTRATELGPPACAVPQTKRFRLTTADGPSQLDVDRLTGLTCPTARSASGRPTTAAAPAVAPPPAAALAAGARTAAAEPLATPLPTAARPSPERAALATALPRPSCPVVGAGSDSSDNDDDAVGRETLGERRARRRSTGAAGTVAVLARAAASTPGWMTAQARTGGGAGALMRGGQDLLDSLCAPSQGGGSERSTQLPAAAPLAALAAPAPAYAPPPSPPRARPAPGQWRRAHRPVDEVTAPRALVVRPPAGPSQDPYYLGSAQPPLEAPHQLSDPAPAPLPAPPAIPPSTMTPGSEADAPVPDAPDSPAPEVRGCSKCRWRTGGCGACRAEGPRSCGRASRASGSVASRGASSLPLASPPAKTRRPRLERELGPALGWEGGALDVKGGATRKRPRPPGPAAAPLAPGTGRRFRTRAAVGRVLGFAGVTFLLTATAGATPRLIREARTALEAWNGRVTTVTPPIGSDAISSSAPLVVVDCSDLVPPLRSDGRVPRRRVGGTAPAEPLAAASGVAHTPSAASSAAPASAWRPSAKALLALARGQPLVPGRWALALPSGGPGDGSVPPPLAPAPGTPGGVGAAWGGAVDTATDVDVAALLSRPAAPCSPLSGVRVRLVGGSDFVKSWGAVVSAAGGVVVDPDASAPAPHGRSRGRSQAAPPAVATRLLLAEDRQTQHRASIANDEAAATTDWARAALWWALVVPFGVPAPPCDAPLDADPGGRLHKALQGARGLAKASAPAASEPEADALVSEEEAEEDVGVKKEAESSAARDRRAREAAAQVARLEVALAEARERAAALGVAL